MSTRCALVTGASRGLGAAIAGRLAADGWPVIINYVSRSVAAAEVAAGIEAAGGTALLLPFDVTDEAAVSQALAQIDDRFGAIGVMVNNATGLQPFIPVADQSWQDHLDQLHFFVKAPLLLLQAVLPGMRAAGAGRVINISSECADLGNPEFGHYVAAKCAMHGLTRSWANELGPDGITVNTVEPGWIPVERHGNVPAATLDSYTATVPLRRIGAPSDVAAVVAYLASEGAGFVTVQRIAVNGGNTMS